MHLDLEHSGPLAPVPPATDATSRLAEWLEHRLDQTTDWNLDEARLYGVTVRDAGRLAAESPDADGAARFSLLDRGFPYDVVEGPAALLAGNFDAVALLTLGWQSPLDDPEAPTRPSRHPKRQRVRIVSVVLIEPVPGAAVLATAIRARGAAVQIHAEGNGRMADAMRNLAAEAVALRLAG